MNAWITAPLFVLTIAAPDTSRVSNAPIEIRAKGGMVVDLERGIGRAIGGVIIQRRDLVVCCDRADAAYAGGRVKAIACRGHVMIRRVDGTVITAEQVNFQPGRQRLALSGGVKVWRLDGQLSGDRVEYALDTGRIEVFGPRSVLKLMPIGDKSRAPASDANGAAAASRSDCPLASAPGPKTP
ncbi:MAG: hypothetical protein AAF449_00835 [Myxococcota bacterium]